MTELEFRKTRLMLPVFNDKRKVSMFVNDQHIALLKQLRFKTQIDGVASHGYELVPSVDEKRPFGDSSSVDAACVILFPDDADADGHFPEEKTELTLMRLAELPLALSVVIHRMDRNNMSPATVSYNYFGTEIAQVVRGYNYVRARSALLRLRNELGDVTDVRSIESITHTNILDDPWYMLTVAKSFLEHTPNPTLERAVNILKEEKRKYYEYKDSAGITHSYAPEND